ncbi:hypothetical protein AKO1_008717 [Acrasis kona]|uniref:WWE domain-containing protein n=1 Tax=Acrasis kona TaxID=1008807 RepID=A0AAW2ZG68_9EUKA
MNLVDVSRQSTTYEMRLFKYAKRGFRVGVPGFDRALIKNREITNTSAFTQLCIKLRKNIKRRKYKEYSGLARLLLLEQGLVYGKREAFTQIGLKGTNNYHPNHVKMLELEIDDCQDVIKKDKFGRDKRTLDYISLFVPFKQKYSPRYFLYRYEKNLLHYRDKINSTYKSDFLVCLNQIDPILNNHDDSFTCIVGQIKWLTVNPGTQIVGSFNPVDTNFYECAYTRTEQQQKIVELAREVYLQECQEPGARKKIKVIWERQVGADEFEPYSNLTNAKIENAYRKFKNHRTEENRIFDLTTDYKVDFDKMVQQGRAYFTLLRRTVMPSEPNVAKANNKYKRIRINK